MQDWAMTALAVVAPCVFGLGVARLAMRLFDIIASQMPAAELVKNVGVILSWFLGNGALVWGGMFASNGWEELKNIRFGQPTILLTYLCGFGVGLLYAGRDRSLIGVLQRYLTGEELEAVLLIFRYGIEDTADAAQKMGVDEERFKDIFQSAMLKLQEHGDRLTNLIRKK